MISKKYFTIETLNHAIKTFEYAFHDKTDQPQSTAHVFPTKGSIGGNGHENWALLRLLPLIIGHKVPKGDNAWNILLLLKYIVELAVATKHTEESVHFLDCKSVRTQTLSDNDNVIQGETQIQKFFQQVIRNAHNLPQM